jgi:hypothetical protein
MNITNFKTFFILGVGMGLGHFLVRKLFGGGSQHQKYNNADTKYSFFNLAKCSIVEIPKNRVIKYLI